MPPLLSNKDRYNMIKYAIFKYTTTGFYYFFMTGSDLHYREDGFAAISRYSGSHYFFDNDIECDSDNKKTINEINREAIQKLFEDCI